MPLLVHSDGACAVHQLLPDANFNAVNHPCLEIEFEIGRGARLSIR